jgi:ribonucleoside-diphosphate reductase beta chain
MSTNDFSYNPDYLKRQLFLDPAGRVTIQRYEEHAYPTIAKYVKTQKGFFWVPEEITLVKDKIDFKNANETVRHIFTSNLLRQTALDSIQGRSPVECFFPVCSVPEAEALVLWWSAFEQIHSDSYSHIIRNIYNVPADEFNRIHETKEIVEMAAHVGRYYDQLHTINCQRELLPGFDMKANEERYVDAVWMALNASYALEAIRFMVSFATSLGMVENKIFIGNGNIISLILKDELLHTDWTAYIINRVVRDDPRFAAAKERCKDQVMQMYLDVIEEEKAWADYLFKKGTVIGLNAKVLRDFVDWTAQFRLKEIGVKYDAGIKSTPLPWFSKHLNTSKKQTALQENESVSYVIGSMTSDMDYNELPAI